MSRKLKGFILSLTGFIPLQLYLIMVWLPKFRDFSGGLMNLDSRFNYTADDVVSLLSKLGHEGIKYYTHGVIIDFLYAFSMGLLVYFILKIARGNKIKSVLVIRLTCIIPSLYIACDWLENSGILYYLNSYPGNIHGVEFFSIFTTLKQIMPLGACTFLILVLVLRITNKIQSR